MTESSPAVVRGPADAPLHGKRIVLTRPREQTGSFDARVRAVGGVPILAPAIAIGPPMSWDAADMALTRLDVYEWIVFTSANAVRALIERARALEIDRARMSSLRLAAVGPATAAAMRAGLRAPDVTATVHDAEALARQIPVADGTRVLFPCGAMARETLPAALRTRGAVVDEAVVYTTVAGEGVPLVVDALRNGTADAVLFASPSAVSFVAEALGEGRVDGKSATSAGLHAHVFCLGPTTEAAARAAGLVPVATARAATQDELIAEVARWFASVAREEDSVR